MKQSKAFQPFVGCVLTEVEAFRSADEKKLRIVLTFGETGTVTLGYHSDHKSFNPKHITWNQLSDLKTVTLFPTWIGYKFVGVTSYGPAYVRLGFSVPGDDRLGEMTIYPTVITSTVEAKVAV